MNPPPLAKRLVVLTALVSALTSVAVLFVAIPKGIDEYVDAPEVTTTIPIVKGSIPNPLGMLHAGSASSCAIEAVPGVWIASADQMDSQRRGGISTAQGNELPVRLFRSPTVPYLVLAAATIGDLPTMTEFGKAVVELAHLSQASVLDCVNKQVMRLQKTPTQFANQDEIPVFVSGEVHGLAVVLDSRNSLMGLVCEHNHSQWFLDTQVLFNLITSAK